MRQSARLVVQALLHANIFTVMSRKFAIKALILLNFAPKVTP